MKRILILGGTGFVGRHICTRLSQAGWSAIVPSRSPAAARHLAGLPRVDVVPGDVHDEATLIRLLGVAELKLRWAEVPGRPTPPAPEPSGPPPLLEGAGMRSSLNCLLAPSYDPLSLMADLARFLQGAGGYLEQSSAYLDPGSAAAYLALCQNSFLSTVLRSRLPLAEVAQQIVAASGRAPLQVLALGAGDGHSETQLVAHLMASGTSRAELCLLDISHPLLTSAYRHAVDRLARQPQVHVWALQGNFHHLPLYTALHRPTASRQRRLLTMLGGTLANLDHEPRFLQQSLLDCQVDDLLLLDLHLPDGDGQRVISALAAEPGLRHTPVVVVSADATQAQIDSALAQGARAYLTKPLDVGQTLDTIDRMLASRSAPPPAAP